MSSSPALRTRLSAIPFSARCLASQWLPQRLDLLPFGSRPLPLGFRFRFWLLGFRIHPLRYFLDAPFSVLSQRPWLYYHALFYLSTTFFKKFIFFSNFYYKDVLIKNPPKKKPQLSLRLPVFFFFYFHLSDSWNPFHNQESYHARCYICN